MLALRVPVAPLIRTAAACRTTINPACTAKLIMMILLCICSCRIIVLAETKISPTLYSHWVSPFGDKESMMMLFSCPLWCRIFKNLQHL
jgi:hypothetical protein